MAEQTITEPTKYWDITSILSSKAQVKAAASGGDAATGAFKKGWPVFAQADGTYLVVAAANVKSQGGAVGILMEDLEDATEGATLQVIYAGVVYVEGVRAAGLDETACPDMVLKNLEGHIVFKDEKEVVYAE